MVVHGRVKLALLGEDIAVSRSLFTSCFGEVHLLWELSIWDFPELAEEAPFGPSSGSMSPDFARGDKGCP